MLIKMEMKFKPKTYNKTLIKIKKLSGISKKVDLKTPMLESFFNSGRYGFSPVRAVKISFSFWSLRWSLFFCVHFHCKHRYSFNVNFEILSFSEELDNEFVSKAVTELKTEWDDLNNKISEAGRTLEGYEDYYKWQDSSDMFLSRWSWIIIKFGTGWKPAYIILLLEVNFRPCMSTAGPPIYPSIQLNKF